MDWIAHIKDFSERLAALGDGHDLNTPTPTCGDWNLEELIWHLVEVQTFWAHVIGTRPAPPDDYLPPSRPVALEVAEGLRRANHGLLVSLRGASPSEEAWSWTDEHTVAFTLRRQAHESLVHLVDGLMAVGEPLPEVPPALAADGVDEILRVMLAAIPEWASFEREPVALELVATDTGGRWLIGPGRLTGTSPNSGTAVDEVGYAFFDTHRGALAALDPETKPDVTIAATALSLDLWLWRRAPFDAVKVDGDLKLASQLRETSAIL